VEGLKKRAAEIGVLMEKSQSQLAALKQCRRSLRSRDESLVLAPSSRSALTRH
jgi:hypothetical protein